VAIVDRCCAEGEVPSHRLASSLTIIDNARGRANHAINQPQPLNPQPRVKGANKRNIVDAKYTLRMNGSTMSATTTAAPISVSADQRERQVTSALHFHD